MQKILIERHFVTVNTRWGTHQVAYRRCGSGPAVLLLHQSPQSSAEYEPLMRAWADRFTVFAPDYPGFGRSDPLGDDGELELSLDDFAEVLDAFMDRAGIVKACAYGFHTGAGMAVALAANYPNRISAVFSNGYVVLQPDELQQILSGYLPPFNLQWDGAHLLWLWTRNRDQLIFFPWFDRRPEARIARTIPSPEVLHQWAIELLRAGDHYRVGYRAAFTFPGDVPLRQLKVPAIITATETDVLGAFLERITEPAPSVQVGIGGTMEQCLEQAAEFFSQHPGASVGEAGGTQPVPGRMWNRTVQYEHGFVRVRCNLEGRGRPVLLLHDIGESSELCDELASGFMGARPLISFDLPGHGESDAPTEGAGFIAASQLAITAVLDAFKLSTVDAVAQGSASAILVEYIRSKPQRIGQAALCDTHFVDAQLAKDLSANFAPQVSPVWHGGHLLQYWHMARNRSLFWPWYRQEDNAAIVEQACPDASRLNALTLALIQSAAVLPEAAEETFSYPLAGGLIEMGHPVLLAAAPSVGSEMPLPGKLVANPRVHRMDLPIDPAQRAQKLLEFFEG